MEGQFVSDGKLYVSGKLFDGHYKLMRQLNDKRATVAIWLARDINTNVMSVAANDESSGKLVLLMICQPTTVLDIEDEQRWQDEFDAAHDCPHPNLLPPEEYIVLNDTYYLVFPYTETDSLRQFIGKNMSDRMTWKLISDIASGLNELHTHQPQIIHGDIKPSNILVYDNEDFVLTNYGIHFESERQRVDNNNDSMAYLAPERFRDNAVLDSKSDIWAFGAMLYEILTRRKPFGPEGGQNQRNNTPNLPNQSIEIRELIYACLQADPKKRPTAQQIKDLARSKKNFKQKRRTHPHQATQFKDKQDKKKLAAIVAAACLLMGVMFYILVPHHSDDNPSDVDESETIEINHYDEAVRLLSDKNTAAKGRVLLDSLVSEKDWRATYLLSRFYFDTRENDTVFYDKRWEMMRENYGITPDNKTAHGYLFDAFELNENDFMILYQLGCDFKAGTVRGCDRNLDYALWCFKHAESLDLNNVRYQKELQQGRDRISTVDHSPSKPSR